MSDKKPWGGRFAGETLDAVEEYTQSVSYDWKLYEQDIAGSKAHARMLARQGVITDEDCQTIVNGLDQVLAEIEGGEFVWRKDLEDVHMNVESRLTEIIGTAGGRLHTGRSRNDQVALDFRLKVGQSLAAWKRAALSLIASLVDQAEANAELVLPGCTHMQPAQPVSLAQQLLAYACMFRRDVQRMDDCAARTMISPLGAAALAGTTYPLDPESVAHELGMQGVFTNSMDAVSDRDFVIEAVSCASLTMAHLSRVCEELIIWANPNFGYLLLPDQYATGSSIMPQKKNPDVAELMRGKTGRVYGALMSLLTMVKGLPMTYNRDMQEDKEPFFDVDTTLGASLSIMADMMAALGFNGERMHQATSRGFLNATELADYLVGKGMPFREAHHVTGRAVAAAEARSMGLEDFSLEELKGFSELIESDVARVLSYEAAVARREVPGGTGPESVRAQIRAFRQWLDNMA